MLTANDYLGVQTLPNAARKFASMSPVDDWPEPQPAGTEIRIGAITLLERASAISLPPSLNFHNSFKATVALVASSHYVLCLYHAKLTWEVKRAENGQVP